jgi:hypothetical protein
MAIPRERSLRVVPLLLPAFIYALGAWTYLAGSPAAYADFVNWLGITAYRVPQGDTWAVLVAIDCVRQGIDVIGPNACMDFDYSPLWLKLSAFRLNGGQFLWAGLVINAGFLLSLLLLPPARSKHDLLAMAAATCSAAVLFGMERANTDLLLFIVLAIGLALLLRPALLRAAGYGLILLAGLLKYYPMAAMILAGRERAGRFLAVAAVSVALTAAFVALSWPDLSRALGKVPTGQPLGTMFGSLTIPLAIVDEAHLPPGWVRIIHLPMVALGLALGLRRGLDPRTAAALGTLAERERVFLLGGAALILFCFFASQNIAYRSVFLLFTLPGLLALRKFTPGRSFAHAPWWVLVVLWHPLWRNRLIWAAHQLLGTTARDVMRYAVCLVREWFWWSLVVVLIGYVIAFVAGTQAGAPLFAAVARRWPIAKGGATA